MKNVATTSTLPTAWREALSLFDKDLRRRGAAERTRRAYGIDLGQLAAWCAERGLDPEQVDYKTLRRYAAHLSERRVAATTVARKLAASRQFFGTLVEHGQMGANPADLPLATLEELRALLGAEANAAGPFGVPEQVICELTATVEVE